MTNNQIQYWKLQEDKRSNLANEGETKRHNEATEGETLRHNYRTEKESERHNLMDEFNRQQVLAENVRHNKKGEKNDYLRSRIQHVANLKADRNKRKELSLQSAYNRNYFHQKHNELLETQLSHRIDEKERNRAAIADETERARNNKFNNILDSLDLARKTIKDAWDMIDFNPSYEPGD